MERDIRRSQRRSWNQKLALYMQASFTFKANRGKLYSSQFPVIINFNRKQFLEEKLRRLRRSVRGRCVLMCRAFRARAWLGAWYFSRHSAPLHHLLYECVPVRWWGNMTECWRKGGGGVIPWWTIMPSRMGGVGCNEIYYHSLVGLSWRKTISSNAR